MIAVLAVVGASFALISTSQQISSARALTLTRAYYAARAGIDQAVAEARSGDCSSVTATKTVDGVDVNLDCSQVTVRERNDTYLVFTITATAVTGSKDAGTLVRRRLEVQATSL